MLHLRVAGSVVEGYGLDRGHAPVLGGSGFSAQTDGRKSNTRSGTVRLVRSTGRIWGSRSSGR